MPGARFYAALTFVVRFVRYTPEMTNKAPIASDRVIGSARIKKEHKIAEIGTKFINRPAFVGPIRSTPW